MKRFKLLKELPNIWVESIIVDEWDRIYIEKHLPENKDLLESELDLLQTIIRNKNKYWLEEIKEPKSIYDLEVWDKYYSISAFNTDHVTFIDKYNYSSYYENDLEYWNGFLTQEDAEKELNKRKAIAKIKKWIWEKNIEILSFNNIPWYSIEYYPANNELCITEIYSPRIWDIIFENKEEAERCKKECEKEWKILFG